MIEDELSTIPEPSNKPQDPAMGALCTVSLQAALACISGQSFSPYIFVGLILGAVGGACLKDVPACTKLGLVEGRVNKEHKSSQAGAISGVFPGVWTRVSFLPPI